MDFLIAAFESELQLETVALRDKILRKPLGLKFSKEDLSAESNSIHIAAREEELLLACLVLKPDGKKMQMRQVAVDEGMQKKGIGTKMIAYSEEVALKNGAQLMHLHARDVAVPFYLRMDYEIVGPMTVIIGIDHFYMEKKLRDTR